MRIHPRFATAPLVAVMLTVGATPPALAHFSGSDSVDGSQIRWCSTALESASEDARSYATSAWNALGRISIRADGVTTVCDVDWQDAYQPSSTWDGKWFARTGTDAIVLNTYFTAGYGIARRRGVATHGLGHGLGLGHSYSGNVMVANTPARGTINTPQTHDRADYYALWG